MSDEAFRTIPRLATEGELRRLKAATENAVKLSGGGEFEPHTRVKKSVLSKYGCMATPEHFIPADVMLEIDRHNGAPTLTAVLAGMLGYRLVPTNDAAESELNLTDAQAVAKETGDVVNLILALLTGGKRLDAADRRDVLREITEAKATLYRLAVKVGAAS